MNLPTLNSEGILRIARKTAGKAKHKYAWHGVVVIRGGAIVAIGRNYGQTHAEVNALNKMWPSERRGCKLWSIRVTPGGRLASARPCPKCHKYLKKNGIKYVLYSENDGTIQKMRV